jgi:hypothetical protein
MSRQSGLPVVEWWCGPTAQGPNPPATSNVQDTSQRSKTLAAWELWLAWCSLCSQPTKRPLQAQPRSPSTHGHTTTTNTTLGTPSNRQEQLVKNNNSRPTSTGSRHPVTGQPPCWQHMRLRIPASFLCTQAQTDTHAQVLLRQPATKHATNRVHTTNMPDTLNHTPRN